MDDQNQCRKRIFFHLFDTPNVPVKYFFLYYLITTPGNVIPIHSQRKKITY